MSSLLHQYQISRDDLLHLSDVTSAAFLKRAVDDHIALGFGCEVPAKKGRYLAHDGIAAVLTDSIVQNGVCDRKLAATMVRWHNEPLFDLVQRVEWEPDSYFLYLAIGWRRWFDFELERELKQAASSIASRGGPSLPTEVPWDRVGLIMFIGTVKEIAEAEECMRKEEKAAGRESFGTLLSLTLINMSNVLAIVRGRALKHGIEMPLRFTAKPGSADDVAMRAEIADYQKRSQARLRAKGRRRVPVPRSLRMMQMPEGV